MHHQICLCRFFVAQIFLVVSKFFCNLSPILILFFFFCLVWARFVRIFTQIKVMEVSKFWEVFTIVFFFIVWAGAMFNIKPFVALWKVMRWFLIIIFTVLLAGYAKGAIKQWWND